jgi:hypothetical protein
VKLTTAPSDVGFSMADDQVITVAQVPFLLNFIGAVPASRGCHRFVSQWSLQQGLITQPA